MGVDLSAGGVSRTVALQALAKLAERWGVPKTKRHLLLDASESTVNHWFSDIAKGKVEEAKPLGSGTLERISHLVAIYDGLHRLIVGKAADDWMHQENRAFGGQKPIELVLSGHFEDIIRVRRYVDLALHR